jgi:hypothetical protein
MGDSRRSLDGSIAEVRIWSKALDRREIQRTGLPGIDLSKDENLLMWWQFDPSNIESGVVKDEGRLGQDLRLRAR